MRIADFYAFMVEREAIRLRRASGASWPWTDDPILREWKFTNVKREHDRTSRLLIEEFYRPHFNAPAEDILINCATARYFGTIEFMRALGWQQGFNPKRIKTVARQRLDIAERVFTGAYICTNAGHHGPKEIVITDIFLADLWAQRFLILEAVKTRSIKWTIEAIQRCQGFGGTAFMAKETFFDTMYTGLWPTRPCDLNQWTPIGPGSLRGAARVLGHPRVSPAEALACCRLLYAARDEYWPEGWVELELSTMQWVLCEWDKYERVRLGEGRPRSRYHPPEEQSNADLHPHAGPR